MTRTRLADLTLPGEARISLQVYQWMWVLACITRRLQKEIDGERHHLVSLLALVGSAIGLTMGHRMDNMDPTTDLLTTPEGTETVGVTAYDMLDLWAEIPANTPNLDFVHFALKPTQHVMQLLLPPGTPIDPVLLCGHIEVVFMEPEDGEG